MCIANRGTECPKQDQTHLEPKSLDGSSFYQLTATEPGRCHWRLKVLCTSSFRKQNRPHQESVCSGKTMTKIMSLTSAVSPNVYFSDRNMSWIALEWLSKCPWVLQSELGLSSREGAWEEREDFLLFLTHSRLLRRQAVTHLAILAQHSDTNAFLACL